MNLSVLIVDDDRVKADLIVDVLKEISSEVSARVVDSVAEAKTALRTVNFDLLVLDLVLPLNANALKPSRTGGLTLLEWLQDEEKRPGYVIGTSSFVDVADEQAAEFAKRAWCVLRFDLAGSAWSEQLRTLILHIEGAKSGTKKLEYGSDLFVVTALRSPELEQILQLDWNFDAVLKPLEGRQLVRTGTKTISNGQTLKIAAGATSKMGMVWTSLFVANAISQLRPRIVAMAGICMGRPGETNIGDVIVGLHSWNWQAGRLSKIADGSAFFEAQPEPVVASKMLTNLWDDFAGDENIRREIYNDYSGDKPVNLPKLKVSPMVSGSVVIAHESIHHSIFSQDRKIRAVDMETFGVYAACENDERLPPLFFSVKSVSDLGLPEKEDKYQSYCAFVSARILDAFLDRYWSVIYDRFR